MLLALEVPDGVHLAPPIEIALGSATVPARLGRAEVPGPRDLEDRGTGRERAASGAKGYRGTIDLRVPVEILHGARPGRGRLELEVTVRPCDERQCFPPRRVTASVEVDVAPAEGAPRRETDSRQADQTTASPGLDS